MLIGVLLSLAGGVACIEKRDQPTREVDADAGSNEQTEQTGSDGGDVPGSELPECNTLPAVQAVPLVQVQQTRHDLGGVETELAGQKARFSGHVVAQGEGVPPGAAVFYGAADPSGWLRIEGRTEYAESYYGPPNSTVPTAVADAGAITERWTVIGPRELAAVTAPPGTQVEIDVDSGPQYGAYHAAPEISIVVRSGDQALLFHAQRPVTGAGFTLSKGASTCVKVSPCFQDFEQPLVVSLAGMEATLARGETRTLGDYRVWGTGGGSFTYNQPYVTGFIDRCADHIPPPSLFTAVLLPAQQR